MFLDIDIGSFHLTLDLSLILRILLFALPALIGVLLFRSKLSKPKKALLFLLFILVFAILYPMFGLSLYFLLFEFLLMLLILADLKIFTSNYSKKKKVLLFLLSILIFGVLIALALFIPHYFILLK
ncbi:MAG: hypothetical protein IJW96_04275 [Clostridia bacterium]|nr:hypothetical protein [Clostridia bacterium]